MFLLARAGGWMRGGGGDGGAEIATTAAVVAVRNCRGTAKSGRRCLSTVDCRLSAVDCRLSAVGGAGGAADEGAAAATRCRH
jgi:hypothetical protein